MRLPFTSCIAIAILLFASACEERTDLEPVPATEAAAGGDTVVTDVAGVHMEVTTGAWPGPAAVSEEVTPVQVTIENESGQPLRVQYSQFALVGPGGAYYAALPPFQVKGAPDSPALAEGYDPVTGADTSYADFQVMPYYASIYVSTPSYAYPSAFNPLYYESYYEYWDEIDLPTPEMRARALPEGALASGGRVSGFLYFEEVAGEAPLVRFRADLVNAETGTTFGEISIPFDVEE